VKASLSVPDAAVLRILFLGDVFGEPGRRAVAALLPELKERLAADFVIINGENAAAGRGLTPKLCIGLLRAGATVVTLGDHCWDQHELMAYMETEPRLLRPLNFPPGCPGQGSIILETDKGKVAVVNAMGRTFTNPPIENPFLALDREVAALREETPIIFLDFHAEATSEKIAMGRFLDGRVSAVIGTHTHVQTADESIFPGGTAYLTDAGMCGPVESVIGSEIKPVLERFVTSMPRRFSVAGGPVLVCGALVEINPTTGHALKITRLQERWDPDAAPAVD
jgi:2',3'-cyclic-nucleotide 2'-phosphodiesterase